MTINEITSSILGRETSFLEEDMSVSSGAVADLVKGSKVLVIGAAGSIGGAFVTELTRFTPGALHLVDISENNLAEVVRSLRSAGCAIPDDFRTFSIDFSTPEMLALLKAEQYEYVLNFSALKHVRSERDPYTLMRLLEVNVAGNARLLSALAEHKNLRRVFSVSSDKSVRSANLMGASKAFMERVFLSRADDLSFSSARFANVAFSDGSLLHSFRHRLEKGQPLSAPSDVQRYFINHEEAGQLCLLSCFLGNNHEIFFPEFSPEKDMMSFADIARSFLRAHGYEPLECGSSEEALARAKERKKESSMWPCHFSGSDTSGEKMFEEFSDPAEEVDLERFSKVGVITRPLFHGKEVLDEALSTIANLRKRGNWTKQELISAVALAVPEMQLVEAEKNLDQKM